MVDGGNREGECFPVPGARLDQQVMALLERRVNRRGHLELLGTKLVTVPQTSGDRAPGGKDVVQRGRHRGPNCILTSGCRYRAGDFRLSLMTTFPSIVTKSATT